MRQGNFCYNSTTRLYYFVNHPDPLNEDNRIYFKAGDTKSLLKELSKYIPKKRPFILNLIEINSGLEELIKSEFKENNKLKIKIVN